MQEEIKKVYFSIGEVAEMFEVNTSLLRYWEKEFDTIKPYKNKKGNRYFTLNDIETIRTIHYLTKTKGYTLQGAKDAMKNNLEKETRNAKIADTLAKVKNILLEIKEEL